MTDKRSIAEFKKPESEFYIVFDSGHEFPVEVDVVEINEKMIIQSVRADTGGREGKWVALIIATILGFAALAIPYHQAEVHVTTAFEHQILVTRCRTRKPRDARRT